MPDPNPFTPPATAPLTRVPLPVRTFARHFGIAASMSSIPLLPLAHAALRLSGISDDGFESPPPHPISMMIDANPWFFLWFGVFAVGVLATGVALALAAIRRELTGSADGGVQSGTLHGGLSALVTAILTGVVLALLIHPDGLVHPLPIATLGAALGLFFASWIAVPAGLIAGYAAGSELRRGSR